MVSIALTIANVNPPFVRILNATAPAVGGAGGAGSYAAIAASRPLAALAMSLTAVVSC